MVGRLGYHHALVAGDVARDLRRQVVGLAACAGEDAGVDLTGHALDQHFTEFDDGAVQITRVRIERGGLLAQGFDHVRVAVANGRHVVVAVDVFAAVHVPQPAARAAHQVQRLVVEVLVGGAECCLAAGKQILVIHSATNLR